MRWDEPYCQQYRNCTSSACAARLRLWKSLAVCRTDLRANVAVEECLEVVQEDALNSEQAIESSQVHVLHDTNEISIPGTSQAPLQGLLSRLESFFTIRCQVVKTSTCNVICHLKPIRSTQALNSFERKGA